MYPWILYCCRSDKPTMRCKINIKKRQYQIKAVKLLFGIVLIQLIIIVLLLRRLNEIGDEESVGYEGADLAERICPP